MRLICQAQAGQWIKATNEYERIMATAATKGMREVGKNAAKAGSNVIHAAGFRSRKWDLSAKHLPATGFVLNPKEWIHSKVNFLDVFEQGAHIVGNPFLWIPLPSVPLWPGDATRQMSPKKYVQSVGPLVTMRRAGRSPLLGGIVRGNLRAQPFGRFVSRARLRKGPSGSGPTQVIPLFVGIAAATIQKKFDTTPAIEREAQNISREYLRNLEIYESRR